ncbi:MAG: tetratricopeptide repeat protein [Planctomycetaceae bacterium]
MDHLPKTQLPPPFASIAGESGTLPQPACNLPPTTEPLSTPLKVSGDAEVGCSVPTGSNLGPVDPGAPSPEQPNSALSTSAPLNPLDLDFEKLSAALMPALLPAAIETAEGYLELVTRPAAKLGVNPQFRRLYAQKALQLARGCAQDIFDDKHEARRQMVIGQALRLLRRYAAATRAFRRASKCRQLRVDALMALGWCQKRNGEFNGAVVTLTRALAIAPENARLHYNLACYLAGLNQHRAAIYELAWALELQPLLRSRALVEADFDALRSYPAFDALTTPRPCSPS